ncbi:acyl-CoA carboxylase epsilon subunit [Nocardiopsis sp. ATB16-24]|uniref:acyl-CoA carboxylase epsilon subunit n=1 Tax=Nocardiopsis sp. ATB16-24 TaxID=3019555 RepID=UPI003332306D
MIGVKKGALEVEEVAALAAVLLAHRPNSKTPRHRTGIPTVAAWRRPEREPAFGGAHPWSTFCKKRELRVHLIW